MGIMPSMKTDGCPILWRVLHQLKSMKLMGGFGDDSGIAELDQRYATLPVSNELTALRGILAVTSMVECIYAPSVLNLKDKSWYGLTELLRALEGLSDSLEADNVELELRGVPERVVGLTALKKLNVDRSLVDQAIANRRMLSIVASTMHAIRTLRPYLRNPNADVAIVGDDLVFVLRTAHGIKSIPTIVSAARKMMEARL
jgi:hypothetical protein